jgi:tripartite-type tricarboxylate transporter receptor subunit TctC
MACVLDTTIASFIAAGSIAAAAPTAAQNYPTKPIRLIVPFATGGQSDIIARVMAQKLAESFKQSVIVDNRPAGSGTVGTETAVRASPDGYTLVMASAAYATNAALYPLSYDPVTDVAAISLIGESGFVVSLHPSVPVNSVRELIAYDKASPGSPYSIRLDAVILDHLGPFFHVLPQPRDKLLRRVRYRKRAHARQALQRFG